MIWINITDAEIFTVFPCKSWFKWIISGLTESMPPLPSIAPAELLSKRNIEALSPITFIPLDALPFDAQEEYSKHIHLGNRRFSFDFIGASHILGIEDFRRFLCDLELVKEAAHLRVLYADFHDTNIRLGKLALQHYISLSTLERKECLFMSTELSKLIQPKPAFTSKKFCHLARSYVAMKLSYPNPPSNNMLRYDLYRIAGDLGNGICSKCVYNENSSVRKKLSDDELADCPLCPVAGNGLAVPDGKDIFNRYVRTLDEQQLAFARLGQRHWESNYQHVCIRDKPDKVNLIWFSDHHIFDITVAVSRKNGEILYGRPWLTAIFDAASDVLVGWVIFMRPNKNTIAECFCRAAAFKMDSDIHGLCETFYCDRGKITVLTLLKDETLNCVSELIHPCI